MRIAIGWDEHLPIVDRLLAYLTEHGHEIQSFGPPAGEAWQWSAVARDAAEAVARGDADEGILLCWTGTGVSIAANKVRGIRAALCVDAETARGARKWNNANVLCLSMRLTSEPVAVEILDAWFGTPYQPNPQDDACLRVIEDLDSGKK